jgi:hypothetical protein
MRHDYSMPNRHFRYLFFKRGGTIREFKKLTAWHGFVLRGKPPIVTFRNGDRYFADKRSGGLIRMNKPGTRSRLKGPSNLGSFPVRKVPADWDPVGTLQGPVYVPSGKRDYYTRIDYGNAHTRTALARVGRLTGDGEYINVLGGRVLPAKHHTKYWYFLRKRGTFTFSKHHPYGDEAKCFPHPNQRGVQQARFF